MGGEIGNYLFRAVNDIGVARNYLEAAARVIGAEPDEPGFHLMFAPASFLIGHAVELSLNSYLVVHRIKGGRSDHDLKGRLDMAIMAGFKPSEMFVNVVRANHHSWANYQHRYTPKDQPVGFVTPRFALGVVRPEVDDMHALVMAEFQRAFERPETAVPGAEVRETILPAGDR